MDCSRSSRQYDAADPRNTLVAPELERRWNGKLEQAGATRRALAELDAERETVSEEERLRLTLLGSRFADAWNEPACSPELKKQIIRTIVEEVVVDEEPAGVLALTIHWKGGRHTAFSMPKPSPKTTHCTAESDLDVIRKMAVRYGDGDIARVLNKLGRRTGKGHPWSQVSVKTARRRHRIEGRSATLEDPEILTLQGAARYTGTSDTTIKKLVDAGVLTMHQAVPYAPWEIRRADLDEELVSRILDDLRRTGRLCLGDTLAHQPDLFATESSESQE